MIKTFTIGAVTALTLMASSATAATLNLLGSGQTHTIDDSVGFNNIKVGGTFIAPDGTVLDIITGDVKDATNGLELTGFAGRLTYTFLGKEAGNENVGLTVDGEFVNTDTASIGDTFTTVQGAVGLLDFAFGTLSPAQNVGEIMNNGGATAAVANLSEFAIGYVQLSATSFYVLFDDIAKGDRDFDDLALRIDVAPVPLPAGGLLLLSGLAGAAALRRRKKAA